MQETLLWDPIYLISLTSKIYRNKQGPSQKLLAKTVAIARVEDLPMNPNTPILILNSSLSGENTVNGSTCASSKESVKAIKILMVKPSSK